MSDLSFRKIHADTFPRYILSSAKSDGFENLLLSPIEETLKAYQIFWNETLPSMLIEAKNINPEAKYTLESIILQPPTISAAACRAQKKDLTSTLEIKYKIHAANGSSSVVTETLPDILSLSEQGTFIKNGNDYVFSYQLQPVGDKAAFKPNSLENKKVLTLSAVLFRCFTSFIGSFYGKKRQERTPEKFYPAKTLKTTLPLNQRINYLSNRNRKKLLDLLKPLNPLEELSAHATVKYKADTRSSFEYRDISLSYYGKICPVETPDSENAGLVQHLASYARISPEQEIVAPCRSLEDSSICYANAADAKNMYIASEATDKITRHGAEFCQAQEPTHVDICKGEILSHAASLIPFLEHDDGHRALMACSMQKQALQLKYSKSPIVGTGRERFIAENSKLCTTSVKDGDLSLGANLLVAYLPWKGYTHEDAIVISDELVNSDILTSVHKHTYTIEIEEGEKLDRIISPATKLAYGDILVTKHKQVSVENTPLDIFLDTVAEDTSLYFTDFPFASSAKVTEVVCLDLFKEPTSNLAKTNTIYLTVSYESKIKVGDKLAGRHGNKGVISLILPKEQMPYFIVKKRRGEEKVHVHILMDPLGIPSRMNLGQLYEAHLGWLALKLAQVKDKATQKKIKEAFSGELPIADTFRNLGQAVSFAIPPFESPSLEDIQKLYKLIGEDDSLKTVLFYDDETSKHTRIQFPNPITVGIAYMLKLDHQIEDKLHTRSTGKYTNIFQQPPEGSRNMGGQRIGEMELWALEAYGATHNIQEILTYKSDDVAGRNQLQQSILEDLPFPEPQLPMSYTVFRQFLRAMCLNLQLEEAEASNNEGDQHEKP